MIIAILLCFGVFVIVMSNVGTINVYSKGIMFCIGLSLLATICLAQNYTQSLILEVNDGLSISNRIAWWIIGEDGWSIELFRNSFEQSMYVSLYLIIFYPFVLFGESKFRK
jgi:hypothetical protein